MVLAMEETQKLKIKNEYPEFEHVYTLCEYVGGEQEIPSVYGQALEQYEEMYDLMKAYIIKLAEKLNEEAKH